MHFTLNEKKVVAEIINRKRGMKFHCLYNTPYITWRIYK